MVYLNKEDKMLIHLKSRTKLIHWILLIICVLLYLFFNALIVYQSHYRQVIIFSNVSKYTLNGVIAQGQVISIILLTLNPLKRSHETALVLCGLTSALALITVVFNHSTDALPGIIVPLTSGAISIIIHNYSKRLKNQLNRVLEYSGIVKQNEAMLHSLAYYDTLTGLPNKKSLMDQIEMLQKKADSFYFVYIHVDIIKTITDMFGSHICDAVLQIVAQRWKYFCHNEDLLARVDDDRFVILICREIHSKQLHEYLKGFFDALKEPVSVGRRDFHVSVSLGVSRFPSDGEKAEELLKNAEFALFKARLGENTYHFFSKALKEEVQRKTQLENDLLSAIGSHEMFLVYQPLYRCESMQLHGFEALLRWQHPKLGLISPIEFIPIAEDLDVICDIGKWTMEAVFNTFVRLREEERIVTNVSINISKKQLMDPSFIPLVFEMLSRTGFEARYLELEISESALISNPKYVVGVMNQLNKLGIGIALDDFGIRDASINDLQTLPIDTLKIDKTFIDKISPSHQMTGAIIALSHTLGLKVAAEGVEHQQQLDYLAAHKCDYFQGFLLSKPVAEGKIVEVCRACEHEL